MMTSSHQIPRRIKPPSPSTAIKCPRCDSMNTKFCYYNNYSLSQPRHFCKNCRRYWTRGGSLRNIPIGGSTRQKNKLSGDPFPPSSLFSFQTTSYSPVISSGGFSSYIDPNFVSLNQDLLRKIQQQRIVTSMFLQDSSPVNEKPLTAPVPAPVMIPPLAGWGFEISGNNENSGNGEGNLENWYCNGMP